MAAETPSSVMYADFRRFGGIAHRDTAQILLDTSVCIGGRSLKQRIDDRTFLSREIVHADPAQLHPEFFADFTVSAKRIAAKLIAARGGRQAGCSEVIAHYRGAAATCMRDALAEAGIDPMPYANTVRKVMSLHLELESDRALLLVMLFTVTGCLADPREAVETVDAFATAELNATLDTLVTSDGAHNLRETEPDRTRLGLVRLVGGAFRLPIHELSEAPDGTVIGCLPDGDASIADVDVDVSRRHARIWREGDRWLVADLGSTNGTSVVSGADKSVHVVSAGNGPGESLPFELRNSDILCLGATTRFLVMKLSV